MNNRTVCQTGFSLIELMVAITIGMVIVAGLLVILVTNSRAQSEIEHASRQIENGHYAMQRLTEDLQIAGYYGEFDPTILTAPTELPSDLCDRVSPDELKSDMPLHIQGYDDEDTPPSLSCLSDVRSGTDILVVRRVSTCIAGAANCDGISAGTPYFQASRCNSPTELESGDSANFFALDTDTNKLKRTKRDCTTLADLRRYRTHIYFIANNAIGSDGIPTLKRAELASDGTAVNFLVVPLVDGIENMQLEYGLDVDSNGTPDVYTTQPGRYNGCTVAECVANWQNVVAVRVHLLARNIAISSGHVQEKEYTLGVKADGVTANVTVPPNDSYKRHVYHTFVKLNNPADRREQ
jgi:type IV pilus assembly protein PilW